ncbi:hypothetical protein PGT21_029631 [Puccinia graminis f. sp. tritici]|uniref:Uncharacterized protein n=1 Tax=Puccinia graminis f. sp. tritici TaxID=56615 RepID=A0A5B0MG42_PUCGR|nr:hypothetical protein PGTUg99_027160 [Puccinia graminis f. sp. tritici]KAA1091259.1 hypothetical protein PGT21_029631 [Puccinia graminis f. sp. tritici]
MIIDGLEVQEASLEGYEDEDDEDDEDDYEDEYEDEEEEETQYLSDDEQMSM